MIQWMLRKLHNLGYELWCWTDSLMDDDLPRRG